MSARRVLMTIAASLGALLGGASLWSAPALAGSCPNEAFRVGPSAALPDCRAYEQVTPVEKGRTQDITFKNSDRVLVAEYGSAIYLKSPTPLEPGATESGSRVVFSRTSTGWTMTSLAPAGEEAAIYAYNGIFSNPDLSMFGFNRFTAINGLVGPFSEKTFKVGPAGGPYTDITKTPFEPEGYFVGATSDFSHVLFVSQDHELAPAAKGIEEGRYALYEWSDATKNVQLVNVTTAGALLDKCGAELGSGTASGELPEDLGDISRDGSKVFFDDVAGEPCAGEPEPGVFMRVDGRETVEVAAPEAGAGDPAGKYRAVFQGASTDGSQVLFASQAELTSDDHVHALQLYDYNTETRKLTRVTRGESGTAAGGYENESALISEDGSTVYFLSAEKLTADAPSSLSGTNANHYLYRYDTATGTIHYIAVVDNVSNYSTAEVFTTPDGHALVLAGVGNVFDGPGGFNSTVNQEEIYYYNALDNSMACVSCASGGTASARSYWPNQVGTLEGLMDSVDRVDPMSSNGDMVFFETTQQLVPQDTNSTTISGKAGVANPPGLDVYEWETNGTDGCEQASGCQHLISTGTGGTAAVLLGASADGQDVYFATGSQLVPSDKDEFDDIYDARIDGGFPPSAPTPGACLSCQGVGSPAPLFNTPASVAFTGAGNPVAPVVKTVAKTHAAPKTKRTKKKRHKKTNRRGKRKPKARRSVRRASRGNARSSMRRGR